MRKFLLGAAALVVAGGPAFAADIPAPVYKAPVVAPVPFTWAGWYVGGNGGYSWGRGSTDLTETATTTAVLTNLIGGVNGVPGPGNGLTTTATTGPLFGSGTANVNGWLGGLQAGRNWQYNQWVFGLEADAQITGQRGDTTICLTAGCGAGTFFGTASYSLPWFATFRGRVGVAWDRVLFYATGGLAVGEIKSSYTDGQIGGTFVATGGSNTTRVGWVVGAGVEGALSNNWSVKLEYLYMDLGSYGGTAGGATTSQAVIRNNGDFFTAITTTQTLLSSFNTHMTDSILRVGLNYRFGAGDAVVTKY